MSGSCGPRRPQALPACLPSSTPPSGSLRKSEAHEVINGTAAQPSPPAAAGVLEGAAGGSGDGPSARGGPASGAERRQRLMAEQDKLLKMQGKLSRLNGMLERNRGDKVVRQQVEQKISALRREIAGAEAQSRRAEQSERDKAKMRKWMKF
uniref:Uncharacterized protein n=1 Tax=Tetraselmis sp. GSL018 TaxID=582737 RepID=A0A061S2C1_9CHLO